MSIVYLQFLYFVSRLLLVLNAYLFNFCSIVPGDGIGPEISAAVQKIFAAASVRT